jgi:hypothetical protein
MARVCAECRMPLTPVNECVCPDDDDPADGGGDDGNAAE